VAADALNSQVGVLSDMAKAQPKHSARLLETAQDVATKARSKSSQSVKFLVSAIKDTMGK
jgi:hypothetical protein